ncbi:MAG: flagellar export chaperone FliS [Pirellulales bacterium]
MSQAQRSQYLESKILTAPSHRLHLMLIEGAIRKGREAEAALRRGDVLAADAPAMRLIDIVSEMLVGVRQNKSQLNEQIAELYVFMFRLAGEAKVNDDADKLVELLKLLEFERQTWQQVCDKLGGEAAPTAPPRAPIASSLTTPAAPSAGFSLQA